MLDKESLIEIFKKKYIMGLSIREATSGLGLDRKTVTKYVKIMGKNLESLKTNLIQQKKCPQDAIDEFVKINWNYYIDRIISFENVRKKRKVVSEVRDEILELKESLNTTSATKIYNYINGHLSDTALADISYSSIWRVLYDDL